MRLAPGDLAEIRRLWCPGNIGDPNRRGLRRAAVFRTRLAPAAAGTLPPVAALSSVLHRDKEVAMTSYVRLACVALAFAGTAAPAGAQTWIYEPDVPRARAYEPGYYYGPRAYEPPAYESRAYVPAANAAPLALTPAQRTTIYRTIIPQGRGRGPIVREQIVTEPIAPAPVVRERVAPAGSAYAYAVGSRVADAYALAPMPQAVVSTVPAVRSYRYMVINNRLLLVDPATGVVVAEVND
jgi:hypothetical protein